MHIGDGEIFEHFGHCEMFAIYDYEDADVNKCTKRLVETAGREGHKAMSDLMREEKIDAVIAGNMGGRSKGAPAQLRHNPDSRLLRQRGRRG